MNIVMAMNMGGDDFVAKPFDAGVLTAKIQALLRRTYDFSPNFEILQHREAFLDTAENTLTYKGEKIPLTKNEYRILLCLMENKRKVVTTEGLYNNVCREYAFNTGANTIYTSSSAVVHQIDGALFYEKSQLEKIEY